MPPKAKAAAAPIVSIVVPVWRLSEDRQATWGFTRAQWEALHPTYEIVEGGSDLDVFRKGVCVADGVARARGDIIVVADADVCCDGLPAAVEAVLAGAGWAMPHHRVLRLSPGATLEAVQSGHLPQVRTASTYMQRPYVGVPGGGIVVLHRDTYARAPIDPRFAGWGQEDEAWAVALTTLVGQPRRGVADLYHLWHAPQARMSRTVGSTASRILLQRYRGVRSSPRNMAALVAEAAPVGAA